jgi:hypothetical protein
LRAQFLEGGEFLLTTGLGVGEMATTQRASGLRTPPIVVRRDTAGPTGFTVNLNWFEFKKA